MIADSEERNAGRARSNEVVEGFAVVNGGGVEKCRHRLGESAD